MKLRITLEIESVYIFNVVVGSRFQVYRLVRAHWGDIWKALTYRATAGKINHGYTHSPLVRVYISKAE